VAELRRGDIVLASAPGDYGKPRPALVVQSDFFNEHHPSISLCPVTSHLHAAPIFRIPVTPTRENGLRAPSQIMIDKVVTLRRERVRETVGHLDEVTLARVNRALAVVLGLV
jgi:mRNA interferase MazF